MKNIALDIKRQRLLFEGHFSIEVDENTIRDYFNIITKKLNLRTYGDPIIFSPSGMGKGENQGYDAFVPLIDSGISLYVWSAKKFISLIIYTCKDFDEQIATEETEKFFDVSDSETLNF